MVVVAVVVSVVAPQSTKTHHTLSTIIMHITTYSQIHWDPVQLQYVIEFFDCIYLLLFVIVSICYHLELRVVRENISEDIFHVPIIIGWPRCVQTAHPERCWHVLYLYCIDMQQLFNTEKYSRKKRRRKSWANGETMFWFSAVIQQTSDAKFTKKIECVRVCLPVPRWIGCCCSTKFLLFSIEFQNDYIDMRFPMRIKFTEWRSAQRRKWEKWTDERSEAERWMQWNGITNSNRWTESKYVLLSLLLRAKK